MARQLTRLPAGNQVEVVAAARREHLTAAEVHGVVDLIVACSSRPQVEFILRTSRGGRCGRRRSSPYRRGTRG